MKEFYKDLAKVLESHNVAIVSRVNECGDSEIGFQNMLAKCSYTGRHHFTAYECNFAKASSSFDLKRMDKSLKTPLITAPKGMSREQMKAFIRSKA